MLLKAKKDTEILPKAKCTIIPDYRSEAHPQKDSYTMYLEMLVNSVNDNISIDQWCMVPHKIIIWCRQENHFEHGEDWHSSLAQEQECILPWSVVCIS